MSSIWAMEVEQKPFVVMHIDNATNQSIILANENTEISTIPPTSTGLFNFVYPDKTFIIPFTVLKECERLNKKNYVKFLFWVDQSELTSELIIVHRNTKEIFNFTDIQKVKIDPFKEYAFFKLKLEGDTFNNSTIKLNAYLFEAPSLKEQALKKFVKTSKDQGLSREQIKQLLPLDLHEELQKFMTP